MQAIVTIMTVLLSIVLTKIMHQHLTTTDTGLCICGRLSQQLAANILLCHRLTFHKLVELLQVLMGIERDTHALATVTTGTSRFLIVALQRLRNIVVNHKTYIRLIDTHTKGDGSHYDIDTLHQEVILCLRPEPRFQSCMIGSCLDIVGFQDLCQFFHLLS